LQSVSETAQRVERGALYVHAEQVKAGESLGVAIVVEPDGLHFGDALLIATMIIVAGAEAGRRTGIVELGAIHRRGALNRVKGDSSRGVPNGFLHEADTVCRGVGPDVLACQRNHAGVAFEGVHLGVEIVLKRGRVAAVVRAEFADGANGVRVDHSQHARVQVVAMAPVVWERLHQPARTSASLPGSLPPPMAKSGLPPPLPPSCAASVWMVLPAWWPA